MAHLFYTAAAVARAQVVSLTPGGTIEAGDKFLVTLTAEDGATTQTLVVSATGTTVASVCADVTAAVNEAANPADENHLGLFAGITAADQTTHVTLTGTAGVPFYCAVTTTEANDDPADDQTFAVAVLVANRGPKDWNSADNWSTGAKPANGDSVLLDGRALDHIRYGLDQSAVTLALLRRPRSHGREVGQIGVTLAGLPAVTHFKLRISATVVRIGERADDAAVENPGLLFLLDTGSVQSNWLVSGTANQGYHGLPPVMLSGIHASNTLSVSGDTAIVGVGVATPGEASTCLSVINGAANGRVTLGTNVTLTDVVTDGSAARTVIQTATSGTVTGVKNVQGHTYLYGAVAHQLVQCVGGTVFANHRPAAGAGVVTLKMLSADATIDFRGDPRALTITATPNVAAGSRLLAATRAQITHTDGAVAYHDTNHGATA